jgi:WD40 repeat protein
VGRVTSVDFSKDDSILASGGSDGVKLWSVAEQCSPDSLSFPDGVNSFALSPSKPLLAVASGRRISLYDYRTLSHVDTPWNLGLDKAIDIVFSPDGRSIISLLDNHREVRIWDIGTHKQTRVLSHSIPDAHLCRIAITGNGRLVAGAATCVDRKNTGVVFIWDAVTGRELQVLHLKHHNGGEIAFSPDGRRIVSGKVYDDIEVFDVASAQRLTTLKPLHNNNIESVAWSPDGKTIATASWDSTVRLWDADTFTQIAVLQGFRGSVKCCCFSEDSQYLITGGEDELVKYWDTYVARVYAQMPREVLTLRGHTEPLIELAASRDNRLLVSASKHRVMVWRADPN